jgi:hypothetical protein
LTNCIITAAAIVLVVEPIRNWVSALAGLVVPSSVVLLDVVVPARL